jgi:CDGSH-type Zn-finger protein
MPTWRLLQPSPIAISCWACPDWLGAGLVHHLADEREDLMAEVTIEVRPNGPYIVNGSIELRDANGNVLPTQTRTVLCRCGASTNKPFCDGTHSKIGFHAAARAVPESAESATSPNAGAISAGDIKAPAAALDATESAGVISGVDPAQVENVETANTHPKK